MTSIPIGTRFVPPEGDLKSIVEEVLTWIDAVHTALELPLMPVLFTNVLHPYARYVPADGRPDHIELSRFSPHPHLSLAHEIGHLLDHALGNYDVYSSRDTQGPLASVMQVIEYSEAVQTLRDIVQGVQAVEAGVNIWQIRYWLEPEEKWARAYAQYIALRSGSLSMQRELRQSREREPLTTYKHKQWTADDFEAIATAIDRALERLGWR